MTVKQFISRKTAKIRYSLMYKLIKNVTPCMKFRVKDNPRAMTTFLKKTFGNTPLTGVEIGVAFGVNALSICKMLNMKKLILIDPYIPYKQDGVLWTHFINDPTTILNKLSGFNIEFINKKSENAIHDINEPLDFVYIDGNHDYPYVKKDLELYYPKIKKHGVIGGHNFEIEYPGVAKASIEFAEENHLNLDGERYDFWIVKK